MNVYETVGLTWIIFTSSLATAGMVYFAYVGVKIFDPEASERQRQ